MPHLTGEQIHQVIEKHAAEHQQNFTASVVALANEWGMGRATLFTWMRQGIPSRQNVVARRELVRMAIKYGVVTAVQPCQ